MMRSLWSGVAGMQAHQVAMDVEGNNIANVNTIGFKYSRTNFSDMLSQTMKPATAPQGTLGGANPMQVGLGTSVSSITHIFSQGSTQNTDRATDVAIQGDGFFVVSGDGGTSYKYTRAGDFSRDASGNFVNPDGYIVQGWVANFDSAPYLVNTNSSISNINIPAGLTTPANPTANIALKATLNSGDNITDAEKAISTGDFQGYFEMANGNDFTVQFSIPQLALGATTLTYSTDNTDDRLTTDGKFSSVQGLVDELNNVLDGLTQSFNTTIDFAAGDTVTIAINGNTTTPAALVYGTDFTTPASLLTKLNSDFAGIATFAYDDSGKLTVTNELGVAFDAATTDFDSSNAAFDTILATLSDTTPAGETTVTSSLVLTGKAQFVIDSYGKLALINNTGAALDVTFGDGSNDNPLFSKVLQSLNTTMAIAAGETTTSRFSMTNYDDVGEMFNVSGKAFNLVSGQNFSLDMNDIGATFEYVPLSTTSVSTTTADGGAFVMTWADGQTVNVSFDGGTTTTTYIYGTAAGQFDTPTELLNLINADYNAANNVTFTYDGSGHLVMKNGATPIAAGALVLSSTNSSFDTVINQIETAGAAGVAPNATLTSTDAFTGTNTQTTSIVRGQIQDTFASSWNLATSDYVDVTISDGTHTIDPTGTGRFTYGTDFSTPSELLEAINSALTTAGIYAQASYDSTGKLIVTNTSSSTSLTTIAMTSTNSSMNDVLQELSGSTLAAGAHLNSTSALLNGGRIYFSTTNDLLNAVNNALDSALISGYGSVDTDSASETYMMYKTNYSSANAVASIDSKGRLTVDNLHSSSPLSLTVNQGISNNALFTDAMSPLTSTIQAGNTASTQPMYAGTFTTTIDIFDSLGSKHTVTLNFRKDHTSTSSTDYSTWRWMASVPSPSTLNGLDPGDVVEGTVSFLPGGGLASVNPTGLRFDPNNGAQLGQQVTLDLGTLNGFDGLIIADTTSSLSNMSQDGYASGDLSDVRVDQTGNIIGSFTNGRSVNLAKIALAKFQNNEGLFSEGGSLFNATANSGDPVIGFANTGGRGALQAQALEMSNVDLSRSMTQLIIVQRGYQANSKTITTSDQMLNTLLQLKQ